MGIEKKGFQEKKMHLDNMTNTAMPQHKTPAPGVMKFTMLVYFSLVIITIYLVCLIYAWE